jgi:SAM-dependent methyltransferase
VTDSLGGSGGGLFAGTAWHYARYRPGYPQAFFDDLVRQFGLDGTGRLLDLGCGTGQLTLPLAGHVAEAVGMDPEPEMLAEAAGQAQATNIANVTWAQGSSTDLPGDLGRFRLVTMGRSFHWMDREQVLAVLDEMVDDVGGVVLANDSCLVRPTTPWQHAIEELEPHFLPADVMPPDPLLGRMNAPVDHPVARGDPGGLALPTRASTDLRIRTSVDGRTGHRLPLLDLAATSPAPRRSARRVRTSHHRCIARDRPEWTVHRASHSRSADGHQTVGQVSTRVQPEVNSP